MSSPSYTEFNKDMFLCNNFNNTSGSYYSKGNEIISISNNLRNATFYNYTEIQKSNILTIDDNIKLLYIIEGQNKPYLISENLYKYLRDNKKNYTEFLQSDKPKDEWLYTFGQLVNTHIKTKDSNTDDYIIDEQINYEIK